MDTSCEASSDSATSRNQSESHVAAVMARSYVAPSPHSHLDEPNRLRPPSLAALEDAERVPGEEQHVVSRRRGRRSLDTLAAGGELVGQRVERGDDGRRRHLRRVEMIQQRVREPENGAVLSTLHVSSRTYVAVMASEVTTKCWRSRRLSRE